MFEFLLFFVDFDLQFIASVIHILRDFSEVFEDTIFCVNNAIILYNEYANIVEI